MKGWLRIGIVVSDILAIIMWWHVSEWLAVNIGPSEHLVVFVFGPFVGVIAIGLIAAIIVGPGDALRSWIQEGFDESATEKQRQMQQDGQLSDAPVSSEKGAVSEVKE